MVFFWSETIMQGVKTLNSISITEIDAISPVYIIVHNMSATYPFMPPETMVKNTMKFSNSESVRYLMSFFTYSSGCYLL